MKLSIIIPVFNESRTIETVLDKVLVLNISGVEKEIVVVDDGSSDKTPEKIEKKKKSAKNIIYIKHVVNKGKGAAVISGIKKSTGDFIIIQDADLEYQPQDIIKLFEPIVRGEAKVVYGTRLKRMPNFSRDERTFRFLLHYIGNKLLSFLTSLLYFHWITDMESGYKLFPRHAVEKMKLNAKGFEFEPEITAKLLKRGYKILELPISTNPRDHKHGKKLNTFRDGIKAFLSLIKYRFTE